MRDHNNLWRKLEVLTLRVVEIEYETAIPFTISSIPIESIINHLAVSDLLAHHRRAMDGRREGCDE